MKRIVIISPSGAFYGSEQVLNDFLSETHNAYEVYVPSGKFYDILINQSRHTIHRFSDIRWLYIRLFARLLLGKIDCVYINEGGHIRYLKLLARMFPSKLFYAHIRLKEDTSISRLHDIPRNLKLISVSGYITRLIQENNRVEATTIHDLYRFSRPLRPFKTSPAKCLNVGIVGRVTDTKGIEYMSMFCEYLEAACEIPITLHFYGDIDTHSSVVKSFINRAGDFRKFKCVFHGYVTEKESIYMDINCLCHFNPIESLGRIAFEALNYGVPFVGFNKGGIGEIADCLGLSSFMVNPTDDSWCEQMFSIIKKVVSEEDVLETYAVAQRKMVEIFSPQNYVQQIEAIFT